MALRREEMIMQNSLKKIVLTEASLAVAITTISLLIAQDSLDQLRAVSATLIALRALFAALNIVVTNAKLLVSNYKQQSTKLVEA